MRVWAYGLIVTDFLQQHTAYRDEPIFWPAHGQQLVPYYQLQNSLQTIGDCIHKLPN
jgi:hypothetical protein